MHRWNRVLGGGLDAAREFLEALNPDLGLAFVLIQHLSPTHVSSLAQILSRATRMPVVQVENEPIVAPNQVYVIPPGKTMTLFGNKLRLEERPSTGVHHCVDAFFKSLAQQQGHKAIAIVLSGTGSDGTIGLEEVKAAGGITMVQDARAAHGGMPESAIRSGCVDLVLSPHGMAAELERIAIHPYVTAAPRGEPAAEAGTGDLKPVLSVLRRAGGLDFAHYKPNTLERRIARRMLLRGTETVQDYVRLLESEAGEAQELFQDVLIGVTEFFRDPELFEALKRDILPGLISMRSDDDPLRIWVPGCSTGQEAYSLGMAVSELIEEKLLTARVQFFATDVNAASIEHARKGVYGAAAAAQVGEARLSRFFEQTGGNYVVAKRIRDMFLFAHHDLTSTPPYSRIDLISCRNVLIYFDTELQNSTMARFHFALNPEGYLILGRSESLGGQNPHFELVDRAHKVFRRKHVFGRASLHVVRSVAPSSPAELPVRSGRLAESDLNSEAERVLLALQTLPSVLVDAGMEIVHFRGDTSAFFSAGEGKASLNAFKMARQGVLVPLRAAIKQAQETRQSSERRIVVRGDGGGERSASMQVTPLSAGSRQGFLVVFRPDAGQAVSSYSDAAGRQEAGDAGALDDPARLSRLERELSDTRAYLESLLQRYENANQELIAANEEALSANEELQSINEELETSKEEIQSTNEELATLNDQLNRASLDQERTTDDLVNLLNCMEVPLIIVSRDQRIRRYTPAAERLFTFIQSDIGRPLADINMKLRVRDLTRTIDDVICSGNGREFEVQDAEGRLSTLRIRPYHATDRGIAGAVLMLLDVDKLRRARDFAESIVATVREPLLVLDADFRVQLASQSFYAHFRATRAETHGRVFFRLGGGEWDTPETRHTLTSVFKSGQPFENFRLRADFTRIGVRLMALNGRLLRVESEAPPLLLLSIEDEGERERRSDAATGLREVQRHDNAFLAMLAHELRNPLAPLRNAFGILRSSACTPAMKQTADAIVDRQLQTMTRLIGDLLDAARLQHGKISFYKGTFDLREILLQCAQTNRPQFESAGTTFDMHIPERPIHVLCDPIRLSQAFDNLLHNALKFTPSGGAISVTAEIESSERGQESSRVVVRVRDNGIGISAEQLPRIFGMFVQADSSLDRREGGLGIGLTLARTIVEECGGFMEAHSKGLGRGSEFVVNLTMSNPPDADATRPEVASIHPVWRTLLVDDNEDAAESLATLLRLHGHHVTTAYEGQTALALQANSRWDVLILDVGLPGMNGYELAAQLRECESTAHAKFIALSGYDRSVSQQAAGVRLFDHYLIKPVGVEDIEDVLVRK